MICNVCLKKKRKIERTIKKELDKKQNKNVFRLFYSRTIKVFCNLLKANSS